MISEDPIQERRGSASRMAKNGRYGREVRFGLPALNDSEFARANRRDTHSAESSVLSVFVLDMYSHSGSQEDDVETRKRLVSRGDGKRACEPH